MRRYLFVDVEVIRHITVNRHYQSSGFETTSKMISLIRGREDYYFDGNILGFSDKESNGVVLASRGSVLTQGVFYDNDSFHGFENASDSQIIGHLQKVLKFALRYWAGNVFSSNEKILDNNKALVWPNSYSVNDYNYKIMIDRSPYSKRLEPRDFKILQVYADGLHQITQDPDYQNLRIFLGRRQALTDFIQQDFKSPNQIQVDQIKHPVKFTELNGVEQSIDSPMPFSNWLDHLTKDQKEFVLANSNSPERLEGAAGTGKTLTLMLKAIYYLKKAIEEKRSCQAIFITHSSATKNQIEDKILSISPEIEDSISGANPYQRLEITTLSDWCISHLGTTIDENQILERDAQDSKTHQYLLIEEVLQNVIDTEFETYRKLLSEDFKNFLEKSERQLLIEMLQFEIGVTIKGKAEEDFEKYLKLLNERSPFGVPARNKSDLDFLFIVYNQYKNRLSNTDQYDVDDIVLTSLGILKTPIWRRRKNVDGYDLVIVDETHLFNFNELSVFHNLLKDDSLNNIVFAIDKTQAVGDRGLTEESLVEQLSLSTPVANKKYNTVFRSSQDIINLAYSILSSGAALFQGRFENPFDASTEFSFTTADESKSLKPIVYGVGSYERMIECPFQIAEKLSDDMNSSKDNVLIVGCSDQITEDLQKVAKNYNKPFEILKRRGDTETVKLARKTNRFVLGAIDFVGGLEFSCVIIVGVDRGRVPPTENENPYNFHFVNYAWHNRLYVAVTRARYRVIMVYEKAREMTPILAVAEKTQIFDYYNYH